MGVIKAEDHIGWRDSNRIICAGCGDPGDAEPLTKDGFAPDDIVTCDDCEKRILQILTPVMPLCRVGDMTPNTKRR